MPVLDATWRLPIKPLYLGDVWAFHHQDDMGRARCGVSADNESPPHNLPPRYNICPTDPVDVVRAIESGRELVPMRWGLVPRWWSRPLKDLRAATFNARAETVETNPFFREAFRRNRCLIPMSGYYEWQNTPAGKQPWYYTGRDGSGLTAAGLWDSWHNPDTGQPLLSCTMIITEANSIAAEIHDRMPVLLAPEQFEPWLSGEVGIEYLKPAPNDWLQKWMVSNRVNSSKAPADDPSLIDQVAPQSNQVSKDPGITGQQDLF